MPTAMDAVHWQCETLRLAGQDACLRLECHAGQVWLNLQVHLQEPPQQHQKFQSPSKNSPSRQRRRERRKAARTASADAVKVFEGDVAENPAAVFPKAVHGCSAEQTVPGHPPQAQQQQLAAGRDDRECPTAEIAPPKPFITQLDGHQSDIDVEPDNDNPEPEVDKLAKLSVMSVCSTDIPPDPYPCRFCLLVSELPNYPSPKPSDPVCTVCSRPIDDRFNPHSCCDMLMHENCWGQHRCIGWEWSNIVCACMHTS